MPFGKYQNWRIENLPDDYLEWLLSIDLRKPLLQAVQSEAQRRGLILKDPPSTLVIAQLIVVGYKQLAKKYHPDCGGSHMDMVRLNEAYENLKMLVKFQMKA